jgi:hypothetical protein
MLDSITRLPNKKALVRLIEDGAEAVFLFTARALRDARRKAREYLDTHPEPSPLRKMVNGKPTAAHPWRRSQAKPAGGTPDGR